MMNLGGLTVITCITFNVYNNGLHTKISVQCVSSRLQLDTKGDNPNVILLDTCSIIILK
jgi:hypothetical protein